MYMNQSTSYKVDTSNQSFIEDVQKWMVLEQQIKTINEKLHSLRESRSEITQKICSQIETKKFGKIELSSGELKMVDKRDYAPLTFTYIKECLDKIVSDPKQSEYIIQYLKDHREIKITPELRVSASKK
jgi:hypothetical protein